MQENGEKKNEIDRELLATLLVLIGLPLLRLINLGVIYCQKAYKLPERHILYSTQCLDQKLFSFFIH